MSQVSQRVAHGLTLLGADSAGEDHRLIGDPADGLDVLDGEAEDPADLVVIEALDNRWDKNDLDVHLPAILDARDLPVVQPRAAGPQIHLVAHAVELKI